MCCSCLLSRFSAVRPKFLVLCDALPFAMYKIGLGCACCACVCYQHCPMRYLPKFRYCDTVTCENIIMRNRKYNGTEDIIQAILAPPKINVSLLNSSQSIFLQISIFELTVQSNRSMPHCCFVRRKQSSHYQQVKFLFQGSKMIVFVHSVLSSSF